MVHDLSKNLEKDVELKRNKKGKGKLIIPFANDEDLERIFNILNN
jgi:ParB family chromosome partitioning protein